MSGDQEWPTIRRRIHSLPRRWLLLAGSTKTSEAEAKTALVEAALFMEAVLKGLNPEIGQDYVLEIGAGP